MTIIALITDFGGKDNYVALMKGVIAGIYQPERPFFIDITHEIPPQNLFAANYCLTNAVAYFPEYTVYVAVVDPGVGSQRRGIAIETEENNYFVGPDNGLFTGIIESGTIKRVVELTNPQYWRVSQPSATFHGRDIFAPVAAHLGVCLERIPLSPASIFWNLGREIAPDSLIKLPINQPEISPTAIKGTIQYIDHFGNLISNISGASLGDKSWRVKVGEKVIAGQKTYSSGENNALIALVNSEGWVEVALNGGSAQEQLKLSIGDNILLQFN